jgi:hypothetical protein
VTISRPAQRRRQRRDRLAEEAQVIGGGVRPGRAGAEHPGQRLGHVIAGRDDRVMAVALEVRLCQLLAAVRGHDGRVQPDAGHALQLPVRDPDRGSPPCRAMPYARACRRAVFTAAVTFRLLRSPPPAISLSARHAAGTDATGPNSSRWSPITRNR